MKFRVASISQHGPNYLVKMIPADDKLATGDVLLGFPIKGSTPEFHEATEHRSEAGGTTSVKPAIRAGEHIIGVKTPDGQEFRLHIGGAGGDVPPRELGEYELTFTKV